MQAVLAVVAKAFLCKKIYKLFLKRDASFSIPFFVLTVNRFKFGVPNYFYKPVAS